MQGGISNGEPIVLRVAFKPTATIARNQDTVSRGGLDTQLLARGRHDPCVVPRAVPMVEAMVALVLADHLLQVRLCLLHPASCRTHATLSSRWPSSEAGCAAWQWSARQYSHSSKSSMRAAAAMDSGPEHTLSHLLF